jgi:hypothetical protein
VDAHSRITVRIENLGTMAEIAEVAKAAAKFNYRMELDRDENDRSVAELSRYEPEWMDRDLAQLVYLYALATNSSMDDVLALTRSKLEQMGAPLDVPPGDRPGIGEGGST